MNINSTLPGIPAYQTHPSGKAATINTVKPEASAQTAPRHAVGNTQGSTLTTQAFANSFYTHEEEPWLNQKPEAGVYEQIPPEFRTSKECFIIFNILDAGLSIAHIHYEYEAFRKRLTNTHPDLAEKNFGLTLGDDGQIKVLDAGKNLTPYEHEWLTEALNTRTDLKSGMHTHAKAMMTLVDHDTRIFGKRHDLSLENFHRVIDYLDIIGRSLDTQRMHDKVVKNIISYADARAGTFEATV